MDPTPAVQPAAVPPGNVPAAKERSPREMRKIAFASFIGTVVEFFDLTIYGYAASLVFAKLFFPELGSSAGTVASFATLGVAFFARPFGSLLFGHFGDRLGRKKTLVTTMMMMGIATILIGAVPPTAQIGIWAPIFLVVLRLAQGIAAGGEWAGATLFISENAPKARRGFWTSISGLGGAGAIFLAALSMLAVSSSMSPESFGSWGWRIPFFASVVLIGVGLWVRLRMEETPVFKAQVKRSGKSTLPIKDAIKSQPRELLLAVGASLAAYTVVYLGASYLSSYGAQLMGLSFNTVLAISAGGAIFFGAGQLVGAIWSDRVGRRRVLLTAMAVGIVWSLVLFPILETKQPVAFLIGLPLTMFFGGNIVGPIGAFLSELFQTRYRYTATGFSYQTAAALGGAVPPLIGAAVVPTYGGFVFGVILAVIISISFVCVLILKETRNYDMDRTTALGTAS